MTTNTPLYGDNRFKAYLESIIDLAKTLVIKDHYTAERINEVLAAKYGSDSIDPFNQGSWKYYLNLGGEYHPTDTKMYVVSMDNMETILFSKESLLEHRATKREYAFGTRNYYELIRQYPEQEMLIKGILNPVDINLAVEAEDLTLIHVVKDYVEDNEVYFIEELTDWVAGFFYRHYNPQYAYIYNTYHLTFLGMFYSQVVPQILSLRMKKIKTIHAHSYHVEQYLLSHGFLDRYITVLTNRQKHFFYRNIKYIQRHTGHLSTFDWLIENVLTERNIPIDEFVEIQSDEFQLEDLYPSVGFRRSPLNLNRYKDPRDIIDLPKLLDTESEQARSNVRLRTDYEPHVDRQTILAPSDELQTKVLESKMRDYSNVYPFKKENVLFNHWLQQAHRGLYTAYLLVSNPTTGERLALSSKDAILVFYYALLKSWGQEPFHLPTLTVRGGLRHPLPTVQQIHNVVDKRLIFEPFIKEARDVLPRVKKNISIDAFFEEALSIFKARIYHHKQVAAVEHGKARGHAEYAVDQFLNTYQVNLYPKNTIYSKWLSERNINFENFEKNDFLQLATDIFMSGTGLILDKELDLATIQRAMCGLFIHLSSYSIHLITDIADGNLTNLGQPCLRVDDWPGASEAEYFAKLPPHSVLYAPANTTGEYFNDLSAEIEWTFLGLVKGDMKVKLPTFIDSDQALKINNRYYLALPNIRYGVVMPSWGSPGKSRDVYNICECDDDLDMLFVALDNLVLGCFYPEDHGDLILYKPEFLDGFGPQDLEIKPVTSLSGFAGQDLKPVTERVPVDVVFGENLDMFEDTYPLWPTLPEGNINGLVWDGNDGKYNLQDLNKDLDGFDNPWD